MEIFLIKNPEKEGGYWYLEVFLVSFNITENCLTYNYDKLPAC